MAGKLAFAFAVTGLLWTAAMGIYMARAFLPGDDVGLVPILIPVALAAGAFVALNRTCHGQRGLSAAWVLGGLLCAYSLITGFSIGVAIMPAAVAMLVAAAIVPRPR